MLHWTRRVDPAAVDRQLVNFLAKMANAPTEVLWLFPMNQLAFIRAFYRWAARRGGRYPFCAAVHPDRAGRAGDRLHQIHEPVDGQVSGAGQGGGSKKVMGAGKAILVRQFIGESLVLSFVSMALAAAITYLALGPFDHLVGKQLTLDLVKPVHSCSVV